MILRKSIQQCLETTHQDDDDDNDDDDDDDDDDETLKHRHQLYLSSKLVAN